MKIDPLLLLCREDVTRTRDPYVPNVVRYQLRYFSKKEARLSELVNVDLDAALKIGCLVLVNQT